MAIKKSNTRGVSLKPYPDKNAAVDLSDWGFEALDEFQDKIHEVIKKCAVEAINDAFTGEETRISLPIAWAPDSDGAFGPAPDDPLTLHLHVDFGGIEHPVFVTSLNEIATHELERNTDGSFSDGLAKFSKALRALADHIDASIGATSDPEQA